MMVRSGTSIKLFINGILQTNATTTIASDKAFNMPELWVGDSNSKIAGFRLIKGIALHTENFTVPTTLPTAVTGTLVLLNFGATAAPTVINHPYQHGNYWTDDDAFNWGAGSILYTSQHSNTLAANVNFNEAEYYWITDANGVVSVATWFSWNGYLHTGDSTTDCNGIYPWQSLYSLVSILTVGTQMYTDGSADNSAQPNATAYAVSGPDNVIIDGHIYHWGSDGKIDSITSCGGY
jgi:hypothetical protein